MVKFKKEENMKSNVLISEIMTKNLVKLNLTDSLSKAEQLFVSHGIRHIPVVSCNEVVGMLSYSDLLKVSVVDFSDDDKEVETTVYNLFSIEQVMTKDVVVVGVDATIREVAQLIADNDFRAVPVVRAGALVGMVTTTDLVRYLAEVMS